MNENTQQSLQQYFTPSWFADLIIRKRFSTLGEFDVVIDPACGKGAFLQAIPDRVSAVGVEADAELVKIARKNTGRDVIEGDFFTASLPANPTLIVGNPPFKAAVVDRFLQRCASVLKIGGIVGFILPAYLFQTSSRVVRYSSQWSLGVELIPRDIFNGLSLPLVFSRFTKEPQTHILGLSFYHEVNAVKQLGKTIRSLFSTTHGKPLWPAVVEWALIQHGGEACLSDIYALIESENKRPTKTKFWREQIRKVLRQYFIPIKPGVYRHPNVAKEAWT